MKLFKEIIREANKSRFLKPLYDEFAKQYSAIPDYKSLLEFVNSDDPLLKDLNWQKITSNKTDIDEKNYWFDIIISSFTSRLEKRAAKIDKKRAHAAGSIIDMAKAEGFRVIESGDDSSNFDGFVHLKNLETDKFTFLVPMSWDACIFCDSSLAGGEGARWCVGSEKDSSFWKDYTSNGNLFVFAFNKEAYKNKEREPDTLKYMIDFTHNYGWCLAWKQSNHYDETFKKEDFKKIFGKTIEEIGEEFKKSILVDDNVYSANLDDEEILF